MRPELFQVVVDEVLDRLRSRQRVDAAAARRKGDALPHHVPAKVRQLRNFEAELINSDRVVAVGRNPDPLSTLARGERVASAGGPKFKGQFGVDSKRKERNSDSERKLFRVINVRGRLCRIPELDLLLVSHCHDGASEAGHPDGPDLSLAENELGNGINVAKGLSQLPREAVPDVDAGVERRRHQRRRVGAELTSDDRRQVASQLEKLQVHFPVLHPVNVDGHSGPSRCDQMAAAGPVEAVKGIFVSLSLAHVVVQRVLEVPNLKDNVKVYLTDLLGFKFLGFEPNF